MELFAFTEDYVKRLIAGDPFVEQHFTGYFGDLLWLKLRARIRSPQLIEDIRQETFLRVLQFLQREGGLDHPERLGAFVNSVCNRVLLEQLRAEGRHKPVSENMSEPTDDRIDLDAPLINEQCKRVVRKVLDEMTAKDRELLRMVYLEECDKGEVCRRMGVASDYLRVLMHRARLRFKAKLLKTQAAVN